MIVVDIETTGLDPEKSCIISIGAVSFEYPDETFYAECRVREDAFIDDESLTVNGFTREHITNIYKQTPEEMIKKFVEWAQKFENRTIAGQNPGILDFPVIRNEIKRAGIDTSFGYRTIDLHSVVYARMLQIFGKVDLNNSLSKIGLTETLKFVGIDDQRAFHNALEDAMLEAECFSRLIKGVSLFPSYSQFPIPDYLVNQCKS